MIAPRTIKVRHLGVLLRVHRRHAYIPAIYRQIKRLGSGRDVTIVVRLDRPSAAVVGAISRIEEKAHADGANVVLLPAAAPTVTARGTAWRESSAECLAALRQEGGAEAAMLWDDDLLYSNRAIKELRGALDFFSEDRVDARWAFCWDSPDQENARFPAHVVAALFRYYPTDEWSTVLDSHAPEYVADSRHSAALTGPALHLGYLERDDRELSWASMKDAGKIDPHTLALVQTPILKPIQHGSCRECPIAPTPSPSK